MNLYIDIHEQKEYLEKLLGICPYCLIDALKAEITVVYEFEVKDDPLLDIKELTDEEIIFGISK